MLGQNCKLEGNVMHAPESKVSHLYYKLRTKHDVKAHKEMWYDAQYQREACDRCHTTLTIQTLKVSCSKVIERWSAHMTKKRDSSRIRCQQGAHSKHFIISPAAI